MYRFLTTEQAAAKADVRGKPARKSVPSVRAKLAALCSRAIVPIRGRSSETRAQSARTALVREAKMLSAKILTASVVPSTRTIGQDWRSVRSTAMVGGIALPLSIKMGAIAGTRTQTTMATEANATTISMIG